MEGLESTIAGATRSDDGARRLSVENPATGEVIGQIPDLGPGAVARIVEVARAAQPAWNRLGFSGRAAVLKAARRRVAREGADLVRSLVAETGKTWEDAQSAELFYACESLRFWAMHAARYLADERVRPSLPLMRSKRLVVRYEPLGVIGVITPWNAPLALSLGDAVPCLMAGNSVVIKPSELTPLTVLLATRIMREAGLPEGVLQVATGGAEAGAALVDSVDMVVFTGSTASGRRVAEQAARRLIPASLELGGKDPLIVLSDANLDRAAEAAVYYSMSNSGQTCIAVERAYVEASVYEGFVTKVVERVRALRQGDPGSGPGTVDVGAMTFAPQLERVDEHVSGAVRAGARALTGGKRRPGPGCFYEPTVLVDVDHQMAAMREETFGPTLPILRVHDAEEAVALANDSDYGLGASIFTRDLERGERLARRIKAGNVAINDPLAFFAVLDAPMGGWKQSGLGLRHGPAGIRRCCRQQTILRSRFNLRRDPHWFPYRRRATIGILRALRLAYGRGGRDRQRGPGHDA